MRVVVGTVQDAGYVCVTDIKDMEADDLDDEELAFLKKPEKKRLVRFLSTLGAD